MKKALLKGVRSRLPAGFDVDTHFTPRYQPWDQRLCVVPNGDLFKAISEQQADIVTGEIQTFTPTGLRLRSGVQLTADIIVTATGLDLLALGGMALAVDGLAIDLPATLAYKSQMLAGVPNFAFAIGYTNASWTLKVDLTSEYVCRLLNYMQTAGYASAVPVLDPAVETGPFMDFQAGYVLRAIDKFPRQGARLPWRVTMNYLRDLPALRHGSVTDDMRFSTSTGQ
jgi:monooxygenase